MSHLTIATGATDPYRPIGEALLDMLDRYNKDFEAVMETALDLGVGVEFKLGGDGYRIRVSVNVPVGQCRQIVEAGGDDE